MTSSRFGRSSGTLLAVATTLLAVAQPGGQTPHPLTAEDGRRLADKLDLIIDHAARGAETRQTVVLSGREVNAYLRFQGAPLLPTGVREPYLTLANAGQVAARAIVNLDAVAQQRERGLLDPLSYLRGSLEVTAQGTLETADGLGQVGVEAVTVAGLPVPHAVLDEVVRYYSRTDRHPEGIDLGEPFELPYRIREVVVMIDQTVVVQ